MGRISAQLLTYITGEPIYAETTLTSADLPLSEVRIAAIPASTWDANRGLSVETQCTSTTDGDMSTARTLDDGSRAYPSSAQRHVSAISGSQIPQDASRTTATGRYLGSPILPATSPQLEHMDVLKTVSAIQEAASGLQASQRRLQETDSRLANVKVSNFDLTSAEHITEDDGRNDPPLTAKHNGHVGMIFSSTVTSTAFGPSQENDHHTSRRSKTAVGADSGLKPLGMQEPFSIT